jgi:ribosomal protein L11 methyltransferase
LVASFATRAAADDACNSLDEEFCPRVDEIVGDAWRDEWKKHFHPFEVATEIVIRPPWESYTPKGNECVLTLEPGRAFGTGLHETTKLVARALERERARLTGARVLDVGTGSGILALVALALGAESVLATDIDDDALRVAHENAEANGMTCRFTTSTEAPGRIAEVFPVVLANIEARVLIPMAEELKARVAKGGLLVLSGILQGQEADVQAAYAPLRPRPVVAMGEWVLVSFDA